MKAALVYWLRGGCENKRLDWIDWIAADMNGVRPSWTGGRHQLSLKPGTGSGTPTLTDNTHCHSVNLRQRKADTVHKANNSGTHNGNATVCECVLVYVELITVNVKTTSTTTSERRRTVKSRTYFLLVSILKRHPLQWLYTLEQIINCTWCLTCHNLGAARLEMMDSIFAGVLSSTLKLDE